MQSYLLVGIGGGLGAVLRFAVSGVVGRWWSAGFPLATFLINVSGSLAMGVLVGVLARTLPAWQEEARLFVAVGVLGGFTTFSAFSLDTVTLIERGELGTAAAYALLSVAGAVLGLYVGLVLTRAAA
jgi:CrcB protein